MDAERPLTEYGRFQAKAVAEELKRRAIVPLLLSSPYTRTLQTAQILQDILGTSPIRETAELASSGNAPALEALLQAYPQAEHLLLIGHQPDLGLLAGRLLGFELGFGPATIAVFESSGSGAWRYLWTAVPENLFRQP